MNAPLRVLLVLTVFVLALPAEARDDTHHFPIEAAMSTPDATARLAGPIRYYFGSQPTPKVLETLGEDVSNRKTNAFGKSAETSCNWVFLSAMLSLQERARQLGANAVINIVSFYKKVEYSSETQFECHDGAFVAGVALKGTFVKLAE